VWASLVPAAGFLVAAFIFREQDTVRASLIALAIGMPFSGLALIGQATLQGMEQVRYLTWTSLLTRIASIAAFVLMLLQGMGVEAAFISRVMFQASAAALFAWKILRDPPPAQQPTEPAMDIARALPFAANRLVLELTTRAPLLLLPILFTLSEIGLYDAADRIRLTLDMMVVVATKAFMPSFSRSFAVGGDDRQSLVSYTLKYVCLALSLTALMVSTFSDVIIHLLYGPEFARSSLILQVLIWGQVLFATDTVLKQAMVASRREHAVVPRALLGLACLTALVIGLGYRFGLVGAAAGVLAAAAAMLALDARYVSRSMLQLDVPRFLLKPLGCALAAGAGLLLLDGASPYLRLAAGLGIYGIAAIVTRLVPKDERAFLSAALRHGFGKRPPAPATAGD
jgi:O-antigen/teichoic acid export membrane protein